MTSSRQKLAALLLAFAALCTTPLVSRADGGCTAAQVKSKHRLMAQIGYYKAYDRLVTVQAQNNSNDAGAFLSAVDGAQSETNEFASELPKSAAVTKALAAAVKALQRETDTLNKNRISTDKAAERMHKTISASLQKAQNALHALDNICVEAPATSPAL